MKILLTILIVSSNALAGEMAKLPHLPLDLTFEESRQLYQNISKQNSQNKNTNKMMKFGFPSVTTAIEGGEKMNSWLNHINSMRSEDNKIRLTSAATQRGIPMDKPSKYGPSTIKATLTKLQLGMPVAMKNIIYGKEEISDSPIVSDEVFIKWARKVSKLYQTSVRFTGLMPWVSEYTARASMDVRGYYALKNRADLDQYLTNHRSLNVEEASQLKKDLLSLCLNSYARKSSCEKKLDRSYQKNTLVEFKNYYWKAAIKNWDRFFKISDPRRDIKWTQKAPGVMEVVFRDPKKPEIANWLKENVEDEFQWPNENWALEMRYTNSGWDTAYIQFQKNVTPHVSGGNKIVMDANTDIQEYGVRWTIRHEFGHILRIPDCYHEFYDADAKLFVNYQIDTTDLMCSRAGKMNERIFQELKRVYLKK